MSKAPKTAIAVGRNRFILALASLPFLFCIASVIVAIMGTPSALMFVMHAAVIGTLALLHAWKSNPWPRLREARVRVEDDRLWIGDASYPRAEIRGGYLVPRHDRIGVIVRLDRGPFKPNIELQVESERQGRALLELLGLSARDAVARFSTMSRAYVHTGYVVAGAMAAGAIALASRSLLGPLFPAGLAGLSVPLGMFLGLGFFLIPAQLDVGADGLLLRWLGWKRFVSYEDITDVNLTVEGRRQQRRTMIHLALSSGEDLRVPVGSATWDFRRSEGIVARIEEARGNYRRGESAHADALVRREGQSHRDWIVKLRQAAVLATHRRAQVSAEALWRIVENPAAQPLERAAAAVTLGAQPKAEGRARIARIADATAAPKLRIAFERAAEEDDDALAEALVALEEEEAKAHPE